MSFICPRCYAPALEICTALELPSDSRSDEITLQVVSCSACQFHGLAVYEESRRGLLETERWDHTGYQAAEELVEELIQTLHSCPEPANPRCTCQVHARFNRQDSQGRWRGLDDLGALAAFRMELAQE